MDEENKIMTTKESANEIRTKLKKEFPNDKFSVSMESFANGSSINIYLMKSNEKIIKNFEDISKDAIYRMENDCNRTAEQIKNLQESKSHQISEYHSYEEYNSLYWNNGVFLTKEGFEKIKKISAIADHPNNGFYLHLNLGKWSKPFVDGKTKSL